MSAYEELVERCAKAAYAKTAEHAPKYYTLPADLVRYAPWEEVSEAWRADYSVNHCGGPRRSSPHA